MSGPRQADRRRGGRPAPLHVLLIEDDPADVTLAQLALTQAMGGVSVRVAGRIDVACEMLEAEQPDVILLDLGLPDATGLEALTRIGGQVYDVPIIVVTGMSSEEVAIDAMELGAQDYVLKGEFTGRLLARSIRYALERKRIERELLTAARYDPVTGLANRAFFLGLLDYALGRADRNGSVAHVMFIDLDHFKQVNDSLGHAAGDELLQGVAKRLRSVVRNTDVVARLGGDEFMILFEGTEAGAVANIADKLVESMTKPFNLAGDEVFISFSIGIAGYPLSGSDVETLVKNADMAMYRAKERGRNTVEFFTDEMNESVRRAFDLEMALRMAIRRSEFEVHYQPIIDQKLGHLHSLEALLRWRPGRNGNLVGPGKFLGILEQTGMIREVGEWVLNTACQQCREWRAQLGVPLRVAVNVSPRQLGVRGFSNWVEDVLDSSGLPADGLEIEITEDVLLEQTESNLSTLESVRKLGVAVAIDDFGSGYSSLGYLTALPFDTVKVDRAFVSRLGDSPDDAIIAGGILAIANDLGRRTVAEGVETHEQLGFLRQRGCSAVQGHLFGKATSHDELEPFLMSLPRSREGGLQWTVPEDQVFHA